MNLERLLEIEAVVRRDAEHRQPVKTTVHVPGEVFLKLIDLVRAVKKRGCASGCWGGRNCDCLLRHISALEEE